MPCNSLVIFVSIFSSYSNFNGSQIMWCSSLGQNLSTSTYVGEITFAIIVATLGLVLFALLIGNMQVSLSDSICNCFFCALRRVLSSVH